MVHIVKPAGTNVFKMILPGKEMHYNKGEREVLKIGERDRRERAKPNSKNGDKRP